MINGYSGTVFAALTVAGVVVRVVEIDFSAAAFGTTALAFMAELVKRPLLVSTVIGPVGAIGGLLVGNGGGVPVVWLVDGPTGGGTVMPEPSEKGKVGLARSYFIQFVPFRFQSPYRAAAVSIEINTVHSIARIFSK
jgi:hypothetical protein